MSVSPNAGGHKVYNNILDCIGNTPLVKLNRVPRNHGLECKMYAKCEYLNPGGSIKDRIAYSMIRDAEHNGHAIPGKTRFVEPTSGNTGIGVSLAAAILGYKTTIVTPDKNSEEKMRTLHLLGSEVVQTPASARYDDPDGFMTVAKQILDADPDAFSLNQFSNMVNPETHYEHTAVEILDALDPAGVDMFVMGAGTGGTVSGAARRLKERFPQCIIVAVDPQGSIIFAAGDKPHPYFVEGIGGDFIPDVLNKQEVTMPIRTDDYDSFNMSREMIREEGLLCGGSSGAITYAAIQAAKQFQLGRDKNVVVILPDGIRNYMSRFVCDQWMEAHLFKEIPDRDFPWWNRCISNLKIISSVPTVNEGQSCADALAAMGSNSEIAFVVDNAKNCSYKGVVSKDSLRSEATNPKRNGHFDFNDYVSKHVMKNVQKIIENKNNPTVGLAARMLDITPFVVVVEDITPKHNIDSVFSAKGFFTSEVVLDYIIENQHPN